MENIRKKFIESTTSRSGPVNALSSTVLADDDPPSTSNAKDAESTGPPAKPPPEQRIQLLQALLSLGDVSAAQYFLAKYPWLAQSHPAIGDLILRLIAHALEDVFRAEIPGFEDIDEDIADRNAVGDREIVPTLYAPSPPETSTKVFKFFYPGWRDEAEKWTSRQDIHDRGMRWFSLVRGIGGRAGSVMAKICRIGTKHFALLKEQKRIEAGMSTNPTVKDDIRRSEVCLAIVESIGCLLASLLQPRWNHGSISSESSYFPLYRIRTLPPPSTSTFGHLSNTSPTLSGISFMENGEIGHVTPSDPISIVQSPSRLRQNVRGTSKRHYRESRLLNPRLPHLPKKGDQHGHWRN